MEIVIHQKKITIGNKYKIFINQQASYRASRQLFQLLAEILLFDMQQSTPVLKINKRFYWFKAKYDIRTEDGTVLRFRTKSYWKRHYQCQIGTDYYDIYGHRGRNYSVYKNNIQIAWWKRGAIVWFEGDNYVIQADDTSDPKLLIAFCLIIDNMKGNHRENILSIHIGHVGLQVKRFNPHWKPKSVES
ncbi:hypothetical protein RYH73_24040 [Olivibacter sp. CPCC 100613]|uniref:hypothetical protein n=1 Tax=Olivibacter sp. CPCC 100613 TaxID=3079931 RepID=UPI002FFB99A0